MNRKFLITFAILPLVGGIFHYNSYRTSQRLQFERKNPRAGETVGGNPAESAKLYANRLILRDLARTARPGFEPRLLGSSVSKVGPDPTGTWRVIGTATYQNWDNPLVPALLTFQAEMHWDPVRGDWVATRVSRQTRLARKVISPQNSPPASPIP